MSSYEPVFNETALLAILTERKPDRIKLLAMIGRLAANPNQDCDFREESWLGRQIDVFVFEKWIVSAWVDHAVKEFRIVNIERI